MSRRNSISVKEKTYDQISELAKRTGTSRSGLVEKWINEALRREDDAARELAREEQIHTVAE
jgi:hypothetical protein